MADHPGARTWPAVDIHQPADADLALAAADDFLPTAVEPRDDDLRVFFATAARRNDARDALRAAGYAVTAVDIEDEDWARRSQDGLVPVTVGRITVAPPWHRLSTAEPRATTLLVIQPSMGFGTGHHATTRLCLRALQTIPLYDRLVLDVGTGSGVLALAAACLGAARAIGVDDDVDAVQCARDNLTLNPTIRGVVFDVADLFSSPLPDADVITANLTGAFLVRAAERLVSRLRARGTLVISGLLMEERDAVTRAFAGGPPIVWEGEEDGWIALALARP